MCHLCDGMTEQDYRVRVIRAIHQRGWAAQYVESDGDRNPSFAYTVGLSRLRHPEIIMFDCTPERGYQALRQLAWPVVIGLRFDEGDDLSDFYAPPERAELLRFPDSSTHLFTANNIYRRDGDPPIPALQLFWPDPPASVRDSVDRRGSRAQ